MYFIIKNALEDNENDALLEGTCSFLEEFPFDFDEGEGKLHRLPEKQIIFEIDESASRGEMRDHLMIDGFTGLFLSKKFKSFFEKLNENNNIEFISIKIIDNYSNVEDVIFAEMRGDKLEYNKIEYSDYFIGNVVGLFDCVDHETSDLEYYTPRQNIPDDMPEEMKKILQEEQEDKSIDFIRKLVLDDAKIPEDIKIFRLKDCPRILVFKEEIVNAIREAKLTGFVFVPLEKYTDEIPDDDDDDEADAAETKTGNKNMANEKTAEALPEEQVALPKTGSRIVIRRIPKPD